MNGETEIKYPVIRYFVNSYFSSSNNAISRVQTIVGIQKNIFYEQLNLNPEIIDFTMQKDMISPDQKAKQSLQAIFPRGRLQ